MSKELIKTCFFREQEGYTQKKLGEILGCGNEDSLVSLIRRLKEFGVLKRVKKEDIDLQEIDNDDYNVAPVIKGDTESLYAFYFVGVLWVNGFVIKCYPKYIQKEVKIEDFKEVLSVIKKYNREKETVIHLQNGLDDSAFNMLALMLYLLNDYYDNGIYTNEQDIIETNGTGEILWDKTINETFAYIKNNKPFYMELNTLKRVNDETDFFSRLHQCILGVCSRELEKQNLFEIFDDVSPVEFDETELEDFGDREYLSYRIERELSVQFNSRKRLLLQSMYAYINNEGSIDSNDHFSMFGTTAYHTIWEDVCKEVLCDMLKVKISSIPQLKCSDGKSLLDYIDKPTWVGFPAKTLIPDIVTVTNDWFAIFDAKYYNVNITEKSISGQPGIESITKQYLYELVYKNLIHENLKVCNAFIFPKDQEEEILNEGDVLFKPLNDIKLSNIKILFVNPKWFYKNYLENKKVLDATIDTIK